MWAIRDDPAASQWPSAGPARLVAVGDLLGSGPDHDIRTGRPEDGGSCREPQRPWAAPRDSLFGHYATFPRLAIALRVSPRREPRFSGSGLTRE